MMTSVVGEGGKVVTHTVSALAGTPLVLGLVLINTLFVAAIGINSHNTNTRKDELLSSLARECLVFRHSGEGPKTPLLK